MGAESGRVAVMLPEKPWQRRVEAVSTNPRRLINPERLIVSVESATVAAVDRVMAQGSHHRHRNRSEFVRRAIEHELARCQSDDLERITRARDGNEGGKV